MLFESHEWKQVTLGEHVDLLAGYAFKSKYYSEVPVGPRVMRGTNVAPETADWNQCAYWPSDRVAGLDEYELAEGDVVLAMDRPWIPAGLKLMRVRHSDVPSLLVQRVARLRGTSSLDTLFLYYLLRHPNFTHYLLGVQTGTTVPHISGRQILGHQFPLPPLGEQRRIAAVLGALDDRIEVGRRMNRTLEATAQALFRRRFVDFDGRDDLVEHEAEPIPEGWQWGRISDLADLNPEKWKKRTAPEHIRYLTLTDVNWGDHDEPEAMSYEDAPSRARRVLRHGDTIYGRVRPGNGSFTLVQDPETNLTGSTGFVVLRPKYPEATHYVYLWVTAPEAVEYFAAVADGSAYPAVPPDVMHDYAVPVPPETSLEEFDEVVRPMFERVSANRRHSRILADLRDALLPKLVSGELRVPEAEESVEAAL
jgi:type I restriction enzyme S subunit